MKDYEIEHKFEQIGERVMLLNACQLHVPKKIATTIAAMAVSRELKEEELILLAIEDITEYKKAEELKKIDEPDHIMVLKARLEPLGYEVIEGIDGEEGFKKAAAEKPDLIILDIMMPGLDGFGVCRLLKAGPGTKDVPILVLTALGSKDLAEKCLEAGADDLLQKPWDAKELEDKIKRLI